MADGHFPTLVSKDRAVNAVANPMWIEASDGANALHKAVDGSAGATDSGIASLVVRDDSLSTLTPADGDYTTLRVDSNGALWVTLTAAGNSNVIADDSAFTPATSYVGAAGFFADETAPDSVDEGDIGAARMTLDRKQLMVLVDKTTDSNRLAIDANGYITVNQASTVNVDIQDSWAGLTGAGTEAGVLRVTIANDSTGLISVDDNGASLTVDANDLDIRNLNLTDDAVKISANATANGPTNPIYVQTVTTGVMSTEIHNWDTSVDVAGDTADNHDYTVTGTTFLLKSVIASCSAGMKVVVQTGPVGSLATIATGFIPKQGGTLQLFFDPPREVPVTSTGTVRVIRTNMQATPNDVYSTIIGNDIP